MSFTITISSCFVCGQWHYMPSIFTHPRGEFGIHLATRRGVSRSPSRSDLRDAFQDQTDSAEPVDRDRPRRLLSSFVSVTFALIFWTAATRRRFSSHQCRLPKPPLLVLVRRARRVLYFTQRDARSFRRRPHVQTRASALLRHYSRCRLDRQFTSIAPNCVSTLTVSRTTRGAGLDNCGAPIVVVSRRSFARNSRVHRAGIRPKRGARRFFSSVCGLDSSQARPIRRPIHHVTTTCGDISSMWFAIMQRFHHQPAASSVSPTKIRNAFGNLS